VAGYRGGWLDEILNMITNIFLVIPTLAVLLVITSYLAARGVLFEAVFVGLFSWPWAARAIRAQTFSLRSREFIDLAKLSGRSGWKVILFEIAPNMSSYLFLTYILLFGGAILLAASLDFIGLGPTGGMSLGLMMYNSVTYGAALQLGIWWWFIPPGIGIIALVGALYVMNVGLDEIFNPKLRDILSHEPPGFRPQGLLPNAGRRRAGARRRDLLDRRQRDHGSRGRVGLRQIHARQQPDPPRRQDEVRRRERHARRQTACPSGTTMA